jgi:hypothetical protein
VGVDAPAEAVLIVRVSTGEVGHHGSGWHDQCRAGYSTERLGLKVEPCNPWPQRAEAQGERAEAEAELV